jgi:hypothetical protein
MKTTKYLSIFALLAIIYGFGGKDDKTIQDACNRVESTEKCKKELNPFRYSAMKTTPITFKSYEQSIETAIPLFYDTKFRFVFNLDGLPQDITVEIYDKAIADPERKLVFESKGQKMFSFEPSGDQFQKLYINYLIPSLATETPNTTVKGCVVLVTGYQNV